VRCLPETFPELWQTVFLRCTDQVASGPHQSFGVTTVEMIKISFGTLARSVDQDADQRTVKKIAVAIEPHQASRAKANDRDLDLQEIAKPGME
jgi:hypothetical protein